MNVSFFFVLINYKIRKKLDIIQNRRIHQFKNLPTQLGIWLLKWWRPWMLLHSLRQGLLFPPLRDTNLYFSWYGAALLSSTCYFIQAAFLTEQVYLFLLKMASSINKIFRCFNQVSNKRNLPGLTFQLKQQRNCK